MKLSSTLRGHLLWLALVLACATARAQDVVVVANRDAAVSQVTSGELREIFTGVRSRFHNGTRAVPVILKGGPAHEVFLRNYIGESPDEFRTGWRKAAFTGQGAMPREFASEDALLLYVAATPGAVGYVSRLSENDKIVALLVLKEIH